MKRKLKVALLAPITFPMPPVAYGPWELVAYNLAQGLYDLGVDVTVFATKQTRIKAKFEWIVRQPLGTIPFSARMANEQIHIIHALQQAHRFDVIHNHLNIHPVLFSQLIDTPVVTTLHGAGIEKFNQPYYDYVKKKAKFISISNSERRAQPDLNYIGTVYNGIDFSKYPVRTKVGNYFVFSGRVERIKGILSAIKLAQKTKIPLKIAGIINDRPFFEKYVKHHIDGRLITYLGNLSQERHRKLLQNALALVFLLEWPEPFGLSVADALATGTPVIAKPLGSMPELIYNKKMGILVKDVNEAAERLDEIRNINSNECRELARKKFSREAMAAGYLKQYLKLVR